MYPVLMETLIDVLFWLTQFCSMYSLCLDLRSFLSSLHLQSPLPCVTLLLLAAAAPPAPRPINSITPPPAQIDGAPWSLWRLAQHQRLLRLQLVGHRHKNSLNVVTVPPAAASISLAVWVFCRSLKQRHGVGVCKLLCHICAHLDGVLEVTFVTN